MSPKSLPVLDDTEPDNRRSGSRQSSLERASLAAVSLKQDPSSPPGPYARRSVPVRPRRMYGGGILKKHPGGETVRLSPDLEAQFSDLQEASAEFEIPKPSGSLVEEVRRILSDLRYGSTVRCLVYLMPDGSIAVDVRGKRPDGIFISIRADGSAQCSGEVEGKVWRKPYLSSGYLPDDDLLDELYRLRVGAQQE